MNIYFRVTQYSPPSPFSSEMCLYSEHFSSSPVGPPGSHQHLLSARQLQASGRLPCSVSCLPRSTLCPAASAACRKYRSWAENQTRTITTNNPAVVSCQYWRNTRSFRGLPLLIAAGHSGHLLLKCPTLPPVSGLGTCRGLCMTSASQAPSSRSHFTCHLQRDLEHWSCSRFPSAPLILLRFAFPHSSSNLCISCI